MHQVDSTEAAIRVPRGPEHQIGETVMSAVNDAQAQAEAHGAGHSVHINHRSARHTPATGRTIRLTGNDIVESGKQAVGGGAWYVGDGRKQY